MDEKAFLFLTYKRPRAERIPDCTTRKLPWADVDANVKILQPYVMEPDVPQNVS